MDSSKEQKPYFNPGLSEKAWEKLHALMSEIILKYAHKNREATSEKKGA
jgi:hypothetical protein